MALETGTYINSLNSANPGANDQVSEGDDHIRLLKSTIKATFPNITGAVTPTHTELNFVDGVTSAIQTQLDAKAPLASPTFTGTPAAPTPSATDSSTKVATTAFVQDLRGAHRGGQTLSVGTQLAASNAGMVYMVSSNVTITLPQASTMTPGDTFLLAAHSAFTIAKHASETVELWKPSTGFVSSISVAAGEAYLIVCADSNAAWYAFLL